MHRVGSLNSAVLWFWSSHNKVNACLAGKEGPLQGWSHSQREGEVGQLGSSEVDGTLTAPLGDTPCEAWCYLTPGAPSRALPAPMYASITRPIFQMRRLRFWPLRSCLQCRCFLSAQHHGHSLCPLGSLPPSVASCSAFWLLTPFSNQ